MFVHRNNRHKRITYPYNHHHHYSPSFAHSPPLSLSLSFNFSQETIIRIHNLTRYCDLLPSLSFSLSLFQLILLTQILLLPHLHDRIVLSSNNNNHSPYFSAKSTSTRVIFISNSVFSPSFKLRRSTLLVGVVVVVFVPIPPPTITGRPNDNWTRLPIT